MKLIQALFQPEFHEKNFAVIIYVHLAGMKKSWIQNKNFVSNFYYPDCMADMVEKGTRADKKNAELLKSQYQTWKFLARQFVITFASKLGVETVPREPVRKINKYILGDRLEEIQLNDDGLCHQMNEFEEQGGPVFDESM